VALHVDGQGAVAAEQPALVQRGHHRPVAADDSAAVEGAVDPQEGPDPGFVRRHGGAVRPDDRGGDDDHAGAERRVQPAGDAEADQAGSAICRHGARRGGGLLGPPGCSADHQKFRRARPAQAGGLFREPGDDAEATRGSRLFGGFGHTRIVAGPGGAVLRIVATGGSKRHNGGLFGLQRSTKGYIVNKQAGERC